jgi:2-phosphosulfolactate phosphatase
MRVHVALTPSDVDGAALGGQTAVAVDVLRATTTVVAACRAGCQRVIPVADAQTALAVAGGWPPGEVLLAGEEGGNPIAGFDLGNSPLEFTADRVAGRVVVLTTTNGTAAMRSAGAFAAAAIAALVNVDAVAEWVLERKADVTVLCSGDVGALSLEDAVCAGLVVQRMMARSAGVVPSAAAAIALHLGEYYVDRFDELRLHSRWARRLAGQGRSADIDACFRVDTTATVPVLEGGAIIVDRPQMDAAAGREGRRATGEATR